MDEGSKATKGNLPYFKILVVGPTAVGKSALALHLASKIRGEIVNCDSVQVYQDLSIGTAKPTLTDRQQTPHHLFDFVPSGASYTAGDYRRDVFALLTKQTIDVSNPLIFVGGSGFYIQAVETGLFKIPTISEEVKKKSSQWQIDHSPSESHNVLNTIDPLSGRSIHPNDHYRIMRALEVFWQTGKPLGLYRQQFRSDVEPFFQLKIGLRISRPQLEIRIQDRVTKMLASGWINECEHLLSHGLDHWAPLNCVGYKEIRQFLLGKITRDQLLPSIIKSTMALAKRQKTWFQRDPAIVWFDGDTDWNGALNFAIESLTRN